MIWSMSLLQKSLCEGCRKFKPLETLWWNKVIEAVTVLIKCTFYILIHISSFQKLLQKSRRMEVLLETFAMHIHQTEKNLFKATLEIKPLVFAITFLLLSPVKIFKRCFHWPPLASYFCLRSWCIRKKFNFWTTAILKSAHSVQFHWGRRTLNKLSLPFWSWC